MQRVDHAERAVRYYATRTTSWGPVATTTFQWKPVPGAVRYELSVSGASGLTVPVNGSTTSMSLPLSLPWVGHLPFSVRVRAFNWAGEPSEWSPLQQFTVIRVG